MEVHPTPELEASLARLAAEDECGADAYVQELVEHYLDHDAWFRQQVQQGLDQLDRGEFAAQEQVEATIDALLRS